MKGERAGSSLLQEDQDREGISQVYFLTLCAAPCPFDLKESKELEAPRFTKTFGFFGLYMCRSLFYL